MRFPDVIVLNGTSSSGKTHLATALQETLREVYMRVSLDAFIDMLPRKAFASNNLVQIFNDCQAGFHRCIAALVSAGNKVIVDTVLDSKEWTEDCICLLEPFHTLYVGVHCPLEELERRENARGDRDMGLAKSQLPLVHLHVQYDIEVNTLENSPEQCAEQIQQHLLSHA
jgi:chloramphenicol 3-O phosphotransferase